MYNRQSGHYAVGMNQDNGPKEYFLITKGSSDSIDDFDYFKIDLTPQEQDYYVNILRSARDNDNSVLVNFAEDGRILRMEEMKVHSSEISPGNQSPSADASTQRASADKERKAADLKELALLLAPVQKAHRHDETLNRIRGNIDALTPVTEMTSVAQTKATGTPTILPPSR
jgi:hypothetical protein